MTSSSIAGHLLIPSSLLPGLLDGRVHPTGLARVIAGWGVMSGINGLGKYDPGAGEM